MSEATETSASKSASAEGSKDRNRAALRKTFLGRVARSVSVSFWVMVIAFSLIRLSPGDPVRIALGTEATDEVVESLRNQFGLNDSYFQQFWNYFTGIFRGDLGYSFFNGRTVTEIVTTHLPVTLMLIGLSIGFAIVLALPVALFVAISKKDSINYLFRATTSISLAIPGFFLALMGLLIFGHLRPVTKVTSLAIFDSSGCQRW